MAGRLFYTPEIAVGKTELPPEEARHLTQVLRLKAGDTIRITDGKGRYADAPVSNAWKDSASVDVSQIVEAPPARYKLHLAVSPLKNPDRLEWLIEKAVELGVHQISLLICKRTEKTSVKISRLESIILSACKQSLTYHFPRISVPEPFQTFIKTPRENAYIAHCEDMDKVHIAAIPNFENGTLLIGPEGDFTPTEIDAAYSAGYTGLSLGNNRLRTETAGMYVASAIRLKQEMHT